MRCILVLGAALLLGGCVYNPYTGLWQPAGYYGYGYRPYYPSPYYGSPYYGYYGSQYGGSPQYGYSPPPSGYQGSPQPLRADARRAAPDAAGTASRGAATTSRRRTDCFDASARWLAGALRRLSAKNEQVWRPTGRRGHVVAAAP